MDLGLTGKACVVTGASSGIGAATAKLLEQEGARVLGVSRSEGFEADVTEPGAAERIVDECERRFGAIDVLVNNAGTSEAKPLEELEDADWQAQWELHVMAPMRLMRVAAPRMAERGGGRIVNVCSSSGKRPSLTNAAYSVTKAAQLSLSRVFADAHAAGRRARERRGPGRGGSRRCGWPRAGWPTRSRRRRASAARRRLEAQAAKIPMGRFGTPEEVANIVVVLCSDLASNVTGAAWSVDGGAVPISI